FAGAPPVWPGSVTAEVGLPSAAIRAHGYGAPAKVPGLPVTVDPVGASASEVARARVDSYDRAVAAAAGVDGLLLRVSRWDGGKAAGPARVSVAYDQFRYAYGGDWASRLRLRALPACALTTPAAPECQGRDLKSINDTTTATVTALVDVAPLEVRDASDKGLRSFACPHPWAPSAAPCSRCPVGRPVGPATTRPRRCRRQRRGAAAVTPETSLGPTRCECRHRWVGQSRRSVWPTRRPGWTGGWPPPTTSRRGSARGSSGIRARSSGSTAHARTTWARARTTASQPATSAGRPRTRACRCRATPES